MTSSEGSAEAAWVAAAAIGSLLAAVASLVSVLQQATLAREERSERQRERELALTERAVVQPIHTETQRFHEAAVLALRKWDDAIESARRGNATTAELDEIVVEIGEVFSTLYLPFRHSVLVRSELCKKRQHRTEITRALDALEDSVTQRLELILVDRSVMRAIAQLSSSCARLMKTVFALTQQ